MNTDSPGRRGLAGRLAGVFVDSKLTPLALIASLVLGLFAIWSLPREEEPQIKVPMIDVMIGLPGASPAEVESRVTRPVEQLLWEIPQVEYVYSQSSRGRSVIIVRFKVGTDPEAALVRLNRRLQSNPDRIPPDASGPIVKPRTIDEVPILAFTLHGPQDQVTLRRLAAQVNEAIKSVPDVAETMLIGGLPRTLRVQLDPAAVASRGLTLQAVIDALHQANRQVQAGSRSFANADLLIEAGGQLRSADDVGAVVLGVFADKPVYLRDVASVIDGGAEPQEYVLYAGREAAGLESAVTLTLAKRPGANAVTVVNRVLARVEGLRGTLLPRDVGVTVVRDYGHTAAEKSNELLLHMGIAVFGVSLLILFFLGWRESLVVLLAIPSTLGLTLLVFYLYGYTLNRITLFALIFSIGILVDDAIVVIENIIRHARQPGGSRQPLSRLALAAVDEVGNPTILATWAVVAAILPMAFVGGLMGPYMRPIPVGATAAMLFSLGVAFAITPWAAVRVYRRRWTRSLELNSKHDESGRPDWFTRLYYRAMRPLLDRRAWRWAFLATIVGLLLAAAGLVGIGAVQVKMLPFDNKSEFQIILNAREGSTLEETLRIAQEIGAAIKPEPEVRDYQIYAGTASPFNFNGLVRHYFGRQGATVADLQVNLVGKDERAAQSHAIAKRIRPRVAAIAAKYAAAVIIAEVPPGPPVLETIVAEIYGPDEPRRLALARQVRNIFARTAGVVDIDWYVRDDQPQLRYLVDTEKAAQLGVSATDVTQAITFANEGLTIDQLHLADEREPVPIRLELAPATRSDPTALAQLYAGHGPNRLVPVNELVRIERSVADRDLYRKNLHPVTYVTADVAGVVESPAYALFAINRELARLDARRFGGATARLPIYHLNVPSDDQSPALKWDGEWHITLEVFRDLGLAFAAVLVLIAMLMVGWFGNYTTPLVVMAAIPFSLIGILPAHWALGAFFTATSMIGFMAGAGIVVRNSIILVDFIELRRGQGSTLHDAVIDAGAVRFRPMLLTALAVVVGASVILKDPIFQGLAISLMFGEIASLLISRIAVPVLFFMAHSRDVQSRRVAPLVPANNHNEVSQPHLPGSGCQTK